METVDSKQAALDVWRAFATRDPAAIRAVLTEDFEWLAPPLNATAVALGKTHHMVGPDAVVRFITVELPRLFARDVSLDITRVIGEGPVVVLEQRLRATLCNGRAYDNDYCFVLEMSGPRVRRMREFMDTRRGYERVFGDAPPGRIA
jgi:ketosteroid isomerase-like protein